MNTQVVTWPIPHTEMRSSAYTLEVEGVDVPVWLARVREAINMPDGVGWTGMLNGPTEWASFARFDADYPVAVTAAVKTAADKAELLVEKIRRQRAAAETDAEPAAEDD